MPLTTLDTAGDTTPEFTLNYDEKASLSIIGSNDFSGSVVVERRRVDETTWRVAHTFDQTNIGEFFINNYGSFDYRVRLASVTAGSVQAEIG